MTLSLTIPLGHGQTATSAASSLAARNFRQSARQFCAEVGMNFTEIVKGDPPALRGLAKLGGFDLPMLTKSSFILEDRRTFALNGQRLVGSMLQRQALVCCPRCLLEDMETGAYAPEISAFARAEWSVTSYRTCAKHDIDIAREGEMPGAAYTHDFALLLRRNLDAVRRSAENAQFRKASPFELNLLGRLQGAPVEDTWLNSIGFSAAARACEIFGAVALLGTRPNLRRISSSELARAATAGYGLLKHGIDTVREFLLDLQRRPGLPGTAGPQQMFGRIYQWLEFGSGDRDLEPVRTMLREHIVETLPVGTDDIVLGQPVRQRRVHSIRSVALQHGVHPVTTRKVLTFAGIAHDARKGLSDNQLLFPSAPADALMEKIGRSITAKQIHHYLDVSRTHLKHLIAGGYLKPVIEGDGLEALYDTTDLDAFIDKVAIGAEVVTRPTVDQISLAEAVKRCCCGVNDILELVWGDKLDWIGTLHSGRAYGALLVSLAEVKSRTRLEATDGVVTNRIARDFGIPSIAAQELVRSGFLRTVKAVNPTNRCPIKLIPADEYHRFRQTYISLRDLSLDRGIWSRRLVPELEAAGVRPLPEWRKFGAYIYRRDQVS